MKWLGRLRNLFRREKMERELDEELRSHIEMRVEENIAAGMTPEKARYDAQRRFGNWMTTKEDTREVHVIGWLETTLQDLRYALRTLRRSPGFAAVAVTLLALGIGATTTIFSVVNGVILQPLRYAQPERLVMVWEKEKAGTPSNCGYATFTDWRAQNHSFSDMAVMSYWMPTLGGDGEPEQLSGQRVSAGFFRILGVTPALGRNFLPQEDVRGNHFVVILSHRLWKRRGKYLRCSKKSSGRLFLTITVISVNAIVVRMRLVRHFASPRTSILWRRTIRSRFAIEILEHRRG